MKVIELKQYLRKVYIELNYNTEPSFEELTAAVNNTLPELGKEDRNLVRAAFVGFAIGKAIGFQEGINYMFEYTPEEQ